MMGRTTDRSSILLLGRNSVIIGALLITVASFGIGYFLGYRGSGSSGQDKSIAETPASREVLPIEDKRIIELPVAKEVAGKAAEAPSPKPQEPAAAKPKVETGGTPSPKSSPEPNKSGANVAAATNKTQDDTAGQPAQAAGAAQAAPDAKAVSAPAPSKSSGHQRGKAIKKAKNRVSSEKLYTVQMGAFPSKEGAEQLSQNLKANGYSPYIVGASGNNAYYKVRVGTFKNKQAAEKSAAAILKKTGLHNFVTAAQ